MPTKIVDHASVLIISVPMSHAAVAAGLTASVEARLSTTDPPAIERMISAADPAMTSPMPEATIASARRPFASQIAKPNPSAIRTRRNQSAFFRPLATDCAVDS